MSMGPDFFGRVSAAARKADIATGKFAAARVTEFAHDLDAVRWKAVSDAMAGQDMPVLSGLRQILEPHIRPESAENMPSKHGIR